MAGKCKTGEVYNQKLQKCVPDKKRVEQGKTRRRSEFMAGARRRAGGIKGMREKYGSLGRYVRPAPGHAMGKNPPK
jgi:hypothetical protein